ncbi:MAG: DNA primase [Clostridiales bacterium]|nr:DNA primase [Clostridiales bacterium]
MALSDSFLQELKYKTDIEDIISNYVSLKKRGSTLVGLCPFHNEKTPSFTVYPETQSFYCFGCGAGGDAVSFIRKIENLDYVDAVKKLAERAGIQMLLNGYDDSLSKKRRRALEANRAAAKYFHSYMMSAEGKAGLDYFLKRGLKMSTIKKFGLGYAPDKWDGLIKHLKSEGFTNYEMMVAGLVRKSDQNYYDNFRNRVMTPIIDVRGNVIAFGGRVLDNSKPKYINTGDTVAYKKTNELFGLNFAKSSGTDEIILCEGYMDVIAMHQAGFTNAVAGCGTALTSEQVHLISRYSNKVILAYDADEAGQKAVARAIELFRNSDIKIKVPVLQYGKDPDEIIKNVGAEKFKGMLEGATNETEYKILKLKKDFNLAVTQGKIDFINAVIKVLADIPPVEQDIYLSRIAEETGVEKRNIKAQFDDYIRKKRKFSRKKEYKEIINTSIRTAARESSENGVNSRAVKAADRFLFLLIKYPDCIKYLYDFDEKCLPLGFIKKVYEIIITNIKNGLDNDLMNFGNRLSADEMGRLSGIIARGKESENPKKEFSDCIKILADEYAKKNSDSASLMNDDEFRKIFKNT